MATKGKAIDKAKENLPAVIDFEGHAGASSEYNKADLAVPYLTILQSLSPQCEDEGDQQIDGAKPGMFFDTVTQELMDGRETGILVIPCAFQSCVVEWHPRESGGGYVATHPAGYTEDGVERNEKNQLVTTRGTLLIDTHYHYVLYKNNDDVWMTAIYAATSTQLKKSRKWNTLMATIKLQGSNGPYNPPRFAFIYRFTTQKESNEAGNWYGVVIEKVEQVSDPSTFQDAVGFHKMVQEGAVKATPQSQETVVPEGDTKNY